MGCGMGSKGVICMTYQGVEPVYEPFTEHRHDQDILSMDLTIQDICYMRRVY